MIGAKIKPDYSDKIAAFVKNGGEIKQAVNTNKAEFNYCNADTVLQSAEKQGLKSYKPVATCKTCGTSERSVKSNICLECDRRRARAKTGLSAKNLEAVGHYLLAKSEVVEFTSGGQKYILKVEVAA